MHQVQATQADQLNGSTPLAQPNIFSRALSQLRLPTLREALIAGAAALVVTTIIVALTGDVPTE